MYNALTISYYIINYCYENDLHLHNLRLQYLLYFVQAYFLIESKGKVVAFDDKLEALDFGPVVRDIFERYRRYTGWCRIPIQEQVYNIEDKDKELIKDVIMHYKDKSEVYLLDLIHSQDPWINAYKSKNREITKEALVSFFI